MPQDAGAADGYSKPSAMPVAYMAGLPLDANVLFMTELASKMPFDGRG